MTKEQFNSVFTHYMQISVAWNDMDALAHVNNTRYFMYMESARVDFLQEYQFLMPMPDESIGPILAYIDCQFIIPLTFPDDIIVGSRISDVGNTSVKLEQAIFSGRQDKLAATSKSVLVLVNYLTGEKIHVPDSVRKLLKAEGK